MSLAIDYNVAKALERHPRLISVLAVKRQCFPLRAVVLSVLSLQVHALTQEMKARGERVVSLCVGEPDFESPPAVIEATAAAAREVCGCPVFPPWFLKSGPSHPFVRNLIAKYVFVFLS